MMIASRHREWIKMANYLGSDHPEDAVQEMYLKLCEINEAEGSLNRFEYHGQVNTMYIFKILQSKVIDAFRQKKREVYDEQQFNPVEPIQECEYAFEDLMSCVKSTIDEMGDYDQMLLELYFVYGFSMREIESRTGIPLHSIFNRLQVSKNIIKQKTKDKYYEYCEQKISTEEVARLGGCSRDSDEGDWD